MDDAEVDPELGHADLRPHLEPAPGQRGRNSFLELASRDRVRICGSRVLLEQTAA
jgi:hypothetical protein